MVLSPLLLILMAVVLALGSVYLLSGKTSPPTSDAEQETRGTGDSTFQADVKKRVEKNAKNDRLRARLVQAGFYSRRASTWLSVTKVLSLLIPFAVAATVTYATNIPIKTTGAVAVFTGVFGMIGPSFILDSRKKKRQQCIRRAIPDALDILGICLEAGVSLPASLARVAQELATAHPELALELAIVDRETRMGRGVGDSMRSFADRFDLEELRSMSTVIIQAERYGSSLTDALEVFAASMRQKRMYAAETLAQQAVAKILIPTVICILPALFVVTMGPAVIMIIRGLANQ